MSGQELVRPSRDGDQFHYLWAARQCLQLLPGDIAGLVAVTIEGPSTAEGTNAIAEGDQLIDVGLYFGDEDRAKARRVRYVQLKHSTRRAVAHWTASGLDNTLEGFAKRYLKLLESFSAADVARRFSFEFTSNRPISADVQEALADLATGAAPRHQTEHDLLVRYSQLPASQVKDFFSLFKATGREKDLWAQRNLLPQDLTAYLPDVDYDAPVRLKDLVARKATTEFETDPSIRRHDVLHALKTNEAQLRPAECLIPDARNTLPREQEHAIRQILLTSSTPIIIHADGGVGKSVLAARLASSMPAGSVAVLYDCFGNGLYRNALNFRHRPSDALVQIANELAARGLCHPLIPAHADVKQYMRAFAWRLRQAVQVVRATDPNASICLIIDAADNAEMAAREQGDAGSFVRDMIRTPLPDGVHLAFTCRSHRQQMLNAPPEAKAIELLPFTAEESAKHLRTKYPHASDYDASEFAKLSSSNPRVQALALSWELSLNAMLKRLGPEPTTIENAITGVLQDAIAQLRDRSSDLEAQQITLMCHALAVLRPLIPLSLIAALTGTSESAIRSFALDIGHPLLLKGSSLHFRDEPTETWFRENCWPTPSQFETFLERVRPLTAHSPYASAALPQLLLQVGRIDELVALALSDDNLPTNPLEQRDVKLRRLLFALKACLQHRHYAAAAKLAIKAGGEAAGEQRQNRLIQGHTDLAAALLSPERMEELVARRKFKDAWMGSHHAYDAGLLSGRAEYEPEAASHLRMAREWLWAWARRPAEERRNEEVSPEDIAEIALATVRLRGAEHAFVFLKRWSDEFRLIVGRVIGRRLLDLGKHEWFDALAVASGHDPWLLLALCAEANDVGRGIPVVALARLLRVLRHPHVKLPEFDNWNTQWTMVDCVRSAIEVALRALRPSPVSWADVIRRYLPSAPPSSLASRFESDRTRLLRAYALEATLRGTRLVLPDLTPAEISEQAKSGRNTYDRELFEREVGGILPWLVLSAEIACERRPTNIAQAVQKALAETTAAERRTYQQSVFLRQWVAVEWMRVLASAGAEDTTSRDAFTAWVTEQKLSIETLTSLCRYGARVPEFDRLAMTLGEAAFAALESSREPAEVRTEAYARLSRAFLTLSPAEAAACFERGVELASRVGEENVERWLALLDLAKAAAEPDSPRPQTAYRLSRLAELTRNYVERDKHFPWNGTAEALTDLCGASAIAILSRWRDRRFGSVERLLPVIVGRLVEHEKLPLITPIVFAGTTAEWDRVEDLERCLSAQADSTQRAVTARVAYRYIRVLPAKKTTCDKLLELRGRFGLSFPDLDRLVLATAPSTAVDESAATASPATDLASNEVPPEPPGVGEVVGQDETVAVGPEAPAGGDSPAQTNNLDAASGDASSLDATGSISPPILSTPPQIERPRSVPQWDTFFAGVDFADSTILHARYADLRNYDAPYQQDRFFKEAWERAGAGAKPDFIRAVLAWPDFGVFELRYLLDSLPNPLPLQPALRTAVRDAVLTVCRREPQRIRRRDWFSWIPVEKIRVGGLLSEAEIAKATLDGCMTQMDGLSAGDIFHILDPLSACLAPSEADAALNFAFTLFDETLGPDDGDGPWRDALRPPANLVDALAGYIWAGLGSAVAAERWQHAHVVRAVVEVGWTELLQSLVAKADTVDAGAFVDQGLAFYSWHARQWLFIALARSAKENPKNLTPAHALLQRGVREHHVLIRQFAADALAQVVASGELSASSIGEIAVNRPIVIDVESKSPLPYDDEKAEAVAAQEDDKYYFGHDIGTYWLNPLCDAFGLTQRAVERRTLKVIKEQLGLAAGYRYSDDARFSRKIFEDGETAHRHYSLPDADNLQTYGAYHAMMIVACDLLRQRSVRRYRGDESDEFSDWLRRYVLTNADGQWIADRRSPRLVPAPAVIDKNWRWGILAGYLDKQLVTDDGRVVLWGDWQNGEGSSYETVSVGSAFVSRVGGEALLAALQTAPNFNWFGLPHVDDGRELEHGPLKLKGWVRDQTRDARIDGSDPWAEGVPSPGPEPSSDVIAALRLVRRSDVNVWETSEGGQLRVELWAAVTGYGRSKERTSGERLSVNHAALNAMLGARSDFMLLVSVEVRRLSSGGSGDDDDDESNGYRWPCIRYYLMGADGVTSTL